VKQTCLALSFRFKKSAIGLNTVPRLIYTNNKNIFRKYILSPVLENDGDVERTTFLISAAESRPIFIFNCIIVLAVNFAQLKFFGRVDLLLKKIVF
jgi:uncharacterized protein YfeS